MSRKRKRPSRSRREASSRDRSTGISEHDRVEKENVWPLLMESFTVDDNGFLLRTHQVRVPSDDEPERLSWPLDVPTLVKGCRSQFAIENCGVLRVSKPERFRYHGETLIADISENIVTQVTSSINKRVDDMQDLQLAKEKDEAFNRGSSLIGSKKRVTTTSVTSTDRTEERQTRTYGKNGWIWCASLEPSTFEGWEQWHHSLDPSYDHVTRIRSPRTFARSLAAMVVDQIGPRGATADLTHQSGELVTHHPSQSVMHGPVVYVDDPYGYVEAASQPLDQMLRAAFCKRRQFEYQREYRFLIWSEQEPDDATVDLAVSPEMLSCVPEDSTPQVPAKPGSDDT